MQACLTHEHLTLYGTNEASIAIREKALQVIVPRLRELREKHHCNALVECTLSASTGRDLVTYAEIARHAKFHVIASTGFYTVDRSPWWMKEASLKELVRRWKEEVRHGMDGTGIRPGILKATSGVEISDHRRRYHTLVIHWFKALAKVHNDTGLPITTHITGNNSVAQLNALTRFGVSPNMITLGHVDEWGTIDQLLTVADKGAYLSFNCIDSSRRGVRRAMVLMKGLIDRGYLSQMTLSADAGFWPRVAQRLDLAPGKRPKRTYRSVFSRMVPALKKLGVTDRQIRQILVDNPRKHLGGVNS